MSTISYSKFLEYVLPYVPGVPKTTAIRSIRDAIIDFCDKSGIYEEVLDGLFVPAGSTDFDLELPRDAKLAGIKSLSPESGRALIPFDHYTVRGSKVYFNHPLSMDMVIVATVSLKPSRESTGCPDYLFEDWAEAIAAGAQALLFSMANEEWMNPKLAQNNYNIYLIGLTRAKRLSKTGRVIGNTRVLTIDFS